MPDLGSRSRDAANREKVRGQAHARRVANRDKIREQQRDRLYNLAPGEYDAMFEAQGGVCAICREPETQLRPDGKVKALAVDHCHETLVNGGLLCHACNYGVGYFRDDPKLLEVAAAYVRRTRPRHLEVAS